MKECQRCYRVTVGFRPTICGNCGASLAPPPPKPKRKRRKLIDKPNPSGRL